MLTTNNGYSGCSSHQLDGKISIDGSLVMDQFAMKVIQHSGDMRAMANISERASRLEAG
jgi:hypothetical protein